MRNHISIGQKKICTRSETMMISEKDSFWIKPLVPVTVNVIQIHWRTKKMINNNEKKTNALMLNFHGKWHEYKNGAIKVYAGDCKYMFKTITDNSVSLVITSPPYCIGKEYENQTDDINAFKRTNRWALKESIRVLKPGGSLCWQVGYHVNNAHTLPLDIIIYNLINDIDKKLPVNEQLILRNRIIWTFGHGFNDTHRLCGRHEIILWYTKGENYTFNLDEIRIPQKYPGKTFSSGPNKGRISGNPKGKNPSDVWDIPNVKANHIEKTIHPCQFPISIPQRLITALTNIGDIVVDPFLGSGTTAASAALLNRRFIGAEKVEKYIEVSDDRIVNALLGTLKYRKDKPVMKPDPNSKVAKKPESFEW